MKKYLLFCFPLLIVFFANAQNKVGIGTPTPLARLHVTDSSVLFSATGLAPVSPGNTPVSGAGRRLMWYADRGALRAGYVSSNKWDQNNIGFYSIAMGFDTKASGANAVAMGNSSTALGQSATAMGELTNANSDFSTAIGYGNTASGAYATAIGNSNIASSLNATAFGSGTSASAQSSTAMGSTTTASGAGSTAMGFSTIASGTYATAMGNNTDAAGESAVAMGDNTTAPGFYAAALGSFTNALGDYSFTMGGLVNARSGYETVFGRYNTIYTPVSTTGWNAADRLFSISNGTGSAARSDALMVLKNGYTGVGTSTPLARLHIKHNSFPDASLLIEETEDDYTRMEFRNTSANSFWQMNAKAQTTSANAQLEFWNMSAGFPTTPLIIYGNGNATLLGNLTESSDARLKRNIVPVKNALQKLTQLNGYNYYWIDEHADPSMQTGVLAQEVQKLFPQLVKEDTKGMMSVNYSGLIPVMIESIKEQQQQIDNQQQQINDLKKLVEKCMH